MEDEQKKRRKKNGRKEEWINGWENKECKIWNGWKIWKQLKKGKWIEKRTDKSKEGKNDGWDEHKDVL